MSTKNFASLDKLIDAMQAYTKKESYIVIRKQFKSNFKSYKIVKIALNCNRDDKTQRKKSAQLQKTNNIKCNCLFKVNAIYKKSLDI